jgi:hypothetical protein
MLSRWCWWVDSGGEGWVWVDCWTLEMVAMAVLVFLDLRSIMCVDMSRGVNSCMLLIIQWQNCFVLKTCQLINPASESGVLSTSSSCWYRSLKVRERMTLEHRKSEGCNETVRGVRIAIPCRSSRLALQRHLRSSQGELTTFDAKPMSLCVP